MEIKKQKAGFSGKQFIIWMAALVLGAILGLLKLEGLNNCLDFIAAAYTRLFKFLAVPTIALTIMTTLAMLGAKKNTGKLFGRTLTWTLLTTLAASVVGAVLFKIIAPGNLSNTLIAEGQSKVPQNLGKMSYYDHILSVFPDNILTPLSTGNVLSILLVAAACGLVLAAKKDSENIQILHKGILGLQEVLFTLIKALVWTLPLGIVAFSAQLSAQLSAGMVVDSLGKYAAVVLIGNLLQFFVILPLFLLCRGLNPIKVFLAMLPAVLMALFTKSSMATLPVTVESAESNLKAKPETARFILPLCCTINMNGCAAFILVTSLFLLQHGNVALTLPVVAMWVVISVISAVGNAGVPMGCYFLTLSLMAGAGAPLWILGLILPIYTIIDMVETAVNVWSDSCVCAMVDKTMSKEA